MASSSGNDGDDGVMLGPMHAPPWEMEKDEAPFPAGMSFDACDKVVAALASRSEAEVAERTYSVSQRWGKILRAKLPDRKTPPLVTLLTCWGSDASIQVVVAVSRDGKTPYEF